METIPTAVLNLGAMMTPRLATTCLLLVTLCAVTPVSGQNPWAKVPALPKACYTKGEPFGAEVDKAIEEGEAAIAAQKETNGAAKAKLNELDMMTKQSRMTDYMRKNPAAAGQKMQEIAASGTKLQEAVREKEKGSRDALHGAVRGEMRESVGTPDALDWTTPLRGNSIFPSASQRAACG